jgi:lipopolysaccharide transport system ATP-binding protein
MKRDFVISVTTLGKKYRLSHNGKYLSLRETLTQLLLHPFSSQKKTTEDFWALKDINFDVKKGEIVGIIGKNGAGKSTLLKILTGLTKPTTGKLTIKGRTGALLEVGTGFHPELSGRENIFLNGAILGMRKDEINKKFNSIVEFAGVERFLDTPVKHYSSGMYVRLAFSVAAHLDPDILIVDEVLAVGDVEFQRKSLGKINEVSEKEGRTVLFVSHNLDVIENICTRVIYIEKGCIKMQGAPGEVINQYLKDTMQFSLSPTSEQLHKKACVTSVKILRRDGKTQSDLPISESFSIEVEFVINERIDRSIVCLVFYAESKIVYVASDGDTEGKLHSYEPGVYRTTMNFPHFFFNVGLYSFDVTIQRPGVDYSEKLEGFNFRIISGNNPRDGLFGGKTYGTMAHMIMTSTNFIGPVSK